METSDPYARFRCPVCGVPWYSYGKLRWPLHSRKCDGHKHMPISPPGLDSKQVRVNVRKGPNGISDA